MKWRAMSLAHFPYTTAPISCHGILGVFVLSTKSEDINKTFFLHGTLSDFQNQKLQMNAKSTKLKLPVNGLSKSTKSLKIKLQ